MNILKAKGNLISVGFTLISLAFSLQTYAHEDNPKSRGYFVDILEAASNGGRAKIGNKANPEAKEHLNCQGAFQSENLYSVYCSSDVQADSPDATIRFYVVLAARNPQNAMLITTENGVEVTAELTCTPFNSSNDTRPLATCH